jgi:energy-coupling factor transporter ATP-binding protein EcfA2
VDHPRPRGTRPGEVALSVRELVVVTGSIASGKSTLCREAARLLTAHGRPAAVVDVDVVYEMLEERGHTAGTPAVWQQARRLALAFAAALFADGLEVVMVECEPLTAAELDDLGNRLSCSGRQIVLRASLETALRRVRDDPMRGVSRDPTFLARHYAARDVEAPPVGFVLETDETAAGELAELVATQSPELGRARHARARHAAA